MLKSNANTCQFFFFFKFISKMADWNILLELLLDRLNILFTLYYVKLVWTLDYRALFYFAQEQNDL